MTLAAAPPARQRVLFDGRTVTIRPIRPDDEGRTRTFLSEASGKTRYLRFHKWVAAPSDKLVHFLTDVDYRRHMAFVCTFEGPQGEAIVGEARYVLNADGRSADFGIMIGDGWRRTGIAGLLMEALLRTAREAGITTMEGLVMRTNGTMLRFAKALGFDVTPVPEDRTTVRVVKTLAR